MDIQIIDCRREDGFRRADHLASELRRASYHVDVFTHVSGEDEESYLGEAYESWPPIVQESAAKRSLILLHVGTCQTGREAALTECYRNNRVMCFTGQSLPPWCLTDCRANQLHGFISGEIPTDDQWPEWSIQQLLKACRLIETGDWITARNSMSSFDAHLEENLDALYAALKNNPSSDELRQLRDKILGS